MPIPTGHGTLMVTECNCTICRSAWAREVGIHPAFVGWDRVRRIFYDIAHEPQYIGREEVGEMPSRREVVRVVPNPVLEELSTTREGELRFPFLIMEPREKVVTITEMKERHRYYRFREQFIGRPFYGASIETESDGYVTLTLRCMIRREEIVTGIRDLEGMRATVIGGVKIAIHQPGDRERLYEAYLRRTRPGYQEVGADFDFTIIPDDESKMERREVQKKMNKFQGWWIPALHQKVKFKECMFLEQECTEGVDGGIETTIFLVDCQGNRLNRSNLVRFIGDNNGELGHLVRVSDISEGSPFRLNVDGTMFMRNI